MLKRIIVAAATAAALAGAALATAAPAAADTAAIQVHGQWPGHGYWNGPGKWKGPDKWHKKTKQVRRSCEPVVRWVWTYGHHKKPVVVGWRCDGPRRHHWNPYW